MCDTILATPAATAGRVMLFGKNSDRQRNEAQVVEVFPRQHHPAGTLLRCTYITIPQAPETHAVVLCRPFWMWGAEMGANEHGLVIGNEAVTTRSPAPEQNALLGMDLVRLALERAATAAEAVSVMTSLLGQYGQGGNCGHLLPAYYHNAFLIADAREAFVLETVDREWLLARTADVHSISNAYSITREATRVSAGLDALIQSSGWSREPQSDYAAALAEGQHIGSAGARRARSTSLLRERRGALDCADAMRILRDHGIGALDHPACNADYAERRTLCLHANANPRSAQTVGSLVSEIREGWAIHWVTGTSAPCTSIFKPALPGMALPAHGPRPSDRFDAQTLWWRHEQLHRGAILSGLGDFLAKIQEERDALEKDFRQRVRQVMEGGSATERERVIASCWADALQIEQRWRAHLSIPAAASAAAFQSEWARMNTLAGLTLRGAE